MGENRKDVPSVQETPQRGKDMMMGSASDPSPQSSAGIVGEIEQCLEDYYDSKTGQHWPSDLLQRARDEIAHNICDCCLGSGKPISGKPCMCGGTGRMSDAVFYLRERIAQLEAESAAGWKKAEDNALDIANLEADLAAARAGADDADIIGGIWHAIGRHQTEICRPDAELAPPQYLLDAVERARDEIVQLRSANSSFATKSICCNEWGACTRPCVPRLERDLAAARADVDRLRHLFADKCIQLGKHAAFDQHGEWKDKP